MSARQLITLGLGLLTSLGGCYLYYINRYSSENDNNKHKNAQPTPRDHIDNLRKTGNENFKKKNYDIAMENYTRAIEYYNQLKETNNSAADCIQPFDLAIFYQNCAACHEALGRYEQVIQDCSSAIELKKDYVKPYVRRAKAYEKLEKYDKAMVDAFSATLLDKFQNQTHLTLADNIVKKSSQAKASEAMKNIKPSWPTAQVIRTYFSAFTLDPIRDKLDGIITSDNLQTLFDEATKPENDEDPLSLLIRGTCYCLLDDTKSAQASFEKLLQFDDTICPPHFKSNALTKQAAIVISEPSSQSSSGFEKDLERVIELIDKAIELDPKNPDIYLHRSQALCLSEKLAEAMQALDKAIELKPDFHSAVAQKFYIELKLAARNAMFESPSKIQDLLEQFEKTVQDNPESLDLHQMYAQILTELNRCDQAEQVLVNLSKMYPNDASIIVSRALLRFHKQSDQDEILNLLREALKVDPKVLFAYEIIGSMESQRGRVDEAIEVFRQSLEYARTESELSRCYTMLDSAISQKAAAELIGTQM